MRTTDFFVRHDLTHFAVETTLGVGQAFYGLLGQGWDIGSFEEREPGSPKVRELPAEALKVEAIVGTLDLDWASGELPVHETISLINAKLNSEEIQAAEIEAIRRLRAKLWTDWLALNPGEAIDLEFPQPNR